MNRRYFLGAAGAAAVSAAAQQAVTGKQSRPSEPVPGARGAAVLLHGEFPDPTVVRDGADFYMTHSHSDAYMPALLTWHSTDLYHWRPVCRALLNYAGNIAAPDLVKHKGRFYIYYPAAGSNWVICADSINGPWSAPVDLKIGGIDPGHVAGPDGKRYLHMSGGHIVPLADDGLSVVGKPAENYAGWNFPDSWNVECFCLESPKLIFHRGYYYLTSAQGGTTGPSTSHMIVSARSRTPAGPWENSPYNPIVHTGSAKERWWSKGHGTLIDDGKDRWYLVYHAYENGYRNLGRQTLIEPVTWTPDGWFKSPYAHSGAAFNPPIIRNNAVESDDFSGSDFKLQWQFAGVDSTADYRLERGKAVLNGSGRVLRALHVRPGDHNYEASFALDPPPGAEAGVILFYCPGIDYYAGIATKQAKIFNLRQGQPFGSPLDGAGIRHFRIRVTDHDVATFFSSDGQAWRKYPSGMEVSGYQANTLGEFASLKIAAYIKGEGELAISDFRYRPLA
jgi:xylan 1,4-beta-xylosidase